MLKYGLKGTYFMCLYELKQHIEGLTSKELSSLCGEDKAAISRTLSNLEDKGLIRFIDEEGKKRYRTVIILTEKGIKICDEISEKVDQFVQINGEGFSNEDRMIFYKVLSIVSSNLQVMSKNED